MLPDTRSLRTFACLSFALVLGACTTTDPKLPEAASLPIPEQSPRVAAAEAPANSDAATDSKSTVTVATSTKSAPEFKDNGTPLDSLISKYSVAYEVPESLVRRIVHRESRGNPQARNGPYWGLMQMLPATARGMGHTGSAQDLLDAETNLKFGVKYLAGAYKVADNNPDQAVRLYARGYYYQAKKKGLLEETGLKPSSTPVAPATMTAMAPAETPPAMPAQLAYSEEPAVAFPAAIPLPMQRPDIASAATSGATTGLSNATPASTAAPL
ncbi:transglycosylase SLT domain-containing protein [Phyllobacterium sp. CCNWLW109]|uniref:transglycosylase SLT domain-containing protein n=1 Tax=Phyllobacterium sp. CCNWLW109 TaxID=3127479 RepID=UPI003FCE5F07